mgnify:CR=1 FL=1
MKLISLGRSICCSLLAVLLFAASGCATSSDTSADIMGNWLQGRSADAPFTTILVIAISPDSNAREAFEQTLAENIDEGGAQGIAAHKYGRQNGSEKLSRDIVLDLAKKAGADAIVVTRVRSSSSEAGTSQEDAILHVGPQIRVEHDEEHHMTTVVESNYSVEVVPGSLVIESDNQLETLVYEPATGTSPIYRAITDAHVEFGPGDHVEVAAYEFANAISKQLRDDEVIP